MITDLLQNETVPVYLCHISALEQYLQIPHGPNVYLFVEGSLIDAAKMFPNLEYPGIEGIDAVYSGKERRYLLLCSDSLNSCSCGFLRYTRFFFHLQGKKYHDPDDCYYSIRNSDPLSLQSGSKSLGSWQETGETGVFVSRFPFPQSLKVDIGVDRDVEVFHQRLILENILTGEYPERGFGFLLNSGFLNRFWPELAVLNTVEQSKEYHPEGNTWEHTMAMFQYRKNRDLVLSLALLLHDVGKADAPEYKQQRFYRHSQIGSRIARKFLRRIGYSEPTIRDVEYLINNHMYVPVLHTLPEYKSKGIVTHPRFRDLVALGLCDAQSSYSDLGEIQKVKRVFKKFLSS